ncbi:MAG TPA: spermidine/putrescine ABC transporter substrate-binding protein [Burkholderiales bacterium]|nr:spermidine/putrescine ABC transporter substrate-binding protein [Burkholderiales bacterium]
MNRRVALASCLTPHASGGSVWLILALALQLLLPGSALSEDVLRLFNWNNYITEDAVKTFEARCRCRLAQDYFGDNEEMLAKLAAGATGYDLIVPTGNVVETLVKSGQLRRLERSKLPDLANIRPEFLHQWFDPGNDWSIPYAYSLTIIGYNEEKLRELGLPTDTWALIFEPKYLEKLKDRVTVLDSQRELFAAALIYLGHSANETDEAKLKQARDLILRAKPYWAAFNATSYMKELTVGNIWVAHGYSNDLYTAQQDARKAGRKFSLAFATPKEGAVFALDTLVIHKSSPRPDLAYQFMEFWLEGQASAELTNNIGAGTPNRVAMRFVNPEIAANRNLFPDAAQFKQLQILRDYDRRTRRLLNRLWVEIKVR